jgi:hypothetical protein
MYIHLAVELDEAHVALEADGDLAVGQRGLFRVWVLGCRVRVQGLEFGVEGVGFRVWGLGLKF